MPVSPCVGSISWVVWVGSALSSVSLCAPHPACSGGHVLVQRFEDRSSAPGLCTGPDTSRCLHLSVSRCVLTSPLRRGGRRGRALIRLWGVHLILRVSPGGLSYTEILETSPRHLTWTRLTCSRCAFVCRALCRLHILCCMGGHALSSVSCVLYILRVVAGTFLSRDLNTAPQPQASVLDRIGDIEACVWLSLFACSISCAYGWARSHPIENLGALTSVHIACCSPPCMCGQALMYYPEHWLATSPSLGKFRRHRARCVRVRPTSLPPRVRGSLLWGVESLCRTSQCPTSLTQRVQSLCSVHTVIIVRTKMR